MSLALQAGLFVGGVAVGLTGSKLFSRPQGKDLQQAATAASPSSSRSATPSANLEWDQRLIGGHPGPVADFLRHAAYVSAYDRAKRHAHWTAEHITAAQLRRPSNDTGGDRSRSVFREDERIPTTFRVRNPDYFRSGYDRGHMVPAADAKSSQQAMDETFLLSNVAPQVGEGFNRDYWAHTEDFVRRLTQHFADVFVFTVPLYLPRQSSDGKWRISYEVIGNPPSVSVPTHFAKVIYGSGRTQGAGSGAEGSLTSAHGPISSLTALGAFVLPNAIIPNDTPLRSFVVPVDAVERAAGLLLFPPNIKANTKALCDTIDCSIIVRDFSDRRPKTLPQSGT